MKQLRDIQILPYHGKIQDSIYSKIQRELYFKTGILEELQNTLSTLDVVNNQIDHFRPHMFPDGSYCLDTFIRTDSKWDVIIDHFNRIPTIVHCYGGGVLCNEVSDLYSQLNELREELKENRSFAVLNKIKEIVSEIWALTYNRFVKLTKQTKSLRRKINLLFVCRNLRNSFRKIIQFLFKNMDDEPAVEVDSIAVLSIIPHFLNKYNELNKSVNRPYQWSFRL